MNYYARLRIVLALCILFMDLARGRGREGESETRYVVTKRMHTIDALNFGHKMISRHYIHCNMKYVWTAVGAIELRIEFAHLPTVDVESVPAGGNPGLMIEIAKRNEFLTFVYRNRAINPN